MAHHRGRSSRTSVRAPHHYGNVRERISQGEPPLQAGRAAAVEAAKIALGFLHYETNWWPAGEPAPPESEFINRRFDQLIAVIESSGVQEVELPG